MESQGEGLKLYLLRHGEATANVDRVFAARKIDPPLSDLGVQQTLQQAESIKAVELDAMYSSSLLRARQTAQIIGQHCGLEVKLSDALKEIDVGILDGQSQEDPYNVTIYEDVINKWQFGLASVGFPGGESLSDIERRFKGFLHALEKRQEKRVLVVGHCLLFMTVIWSFCENHGPAFEDGHMGRGRLSIMSKCDNRFRLLKFNISPETLEQQTLLV